jgi:phospho-N-acetylmuramoyl-pentapeptide-transferase
MTPSVLNFFKVFTPTTLAFFIGIALTPLLTHYLYKYKMWKKQSVAITLDGKAAPISSALHNDEVKKTPRLGGMIIWVSTLVTVSIFWIISVLFPSSYTEKLNFLSRNQTWLPLFTLLVASVVGLLDDIFVVLGRKGSLAGGLSVRFRIGTVVLLGLLGGLWFYTKLDTLIQIPFAGSLELGIWIIPLFIIVMVSLFSSGVIDGLDGLSGGVMAIIFASYAVIAFFQNQIDLAALCATLAGGILAFLWFNIPPARFYMSETGMLGLTTTLTVVAFLTDSVILLPLIVFPLTVTSASNVIQLLSKKFRGKKVFMVAPLHHHFQAIGWPAYKVVMRYWVISIVTAIIGMILVLIS